MAATTVVSAQSWWVRNSLCSAAWTNSAWFHSATVCSPKRRESLTSVVGWGTRLPSWMRQNRCQDRVGDLAAQQLIVEPVAVLEEHQPQVGIDRDRGPAARGIEVGPEGLDERRVV